tara:strand:- start:628 stop:1257 length:630 start_codon:yes stop_codon:yes gene_type:complete
MGLGLYVIIDPYNIGENNFNNLCNKLIESDVDTIQLRNKYGDKKEYMEQSILIKNLCEKNNKKFIINDRLEEALEIMPDGIHVGRNDASVEKCRDLFPQEFIIGNSNATFEEGKVSEKLLTDYVAIGSLFETNSKKDTIPSSLDVIKKLKKTNFKKEIVAIGGINKNRIIDVLDSGADSICISSAITLSKDPVLEANIIKKIMQDYAKQ